MSDPEWIMSLSLDIYNVIQKYNALPRFQEMVQKWASEHEAEIERHKKWQEQRELHFEKNVASDPRLKDKQAGPPKKDWEWENYVLHPYEETESGLQRASQLTTGWVPPKLSISAKPEITHLLPLSREHELTLVEKYTVLAAIYDCGRKGTAKLPPWQWPKNWEVPDAVSKVKKCIFFECLCRSASELVQANEGWLRTILEDVEKDVCNWRGLKSPQLKENIQTLSTETRTDKLLKKIKDRPFISVLIFLGIIIIAVATFLSSIDTIISFFEKLLPRDHETQQTLPESKTTHDSNSNWTEDEGFLEDINMPHQTNEFQSLMTRIEAALHGKRAKVQESAMIHNYQTNSETEVDILVTFDLGGTSYRTAIECRDQNRPAGPPWIAELKAKRDGCRLDKIIAIHSKGFTKSAITLAENYGIETIMPKEGPTIDWGQKILPYEALVFQAIQCTIPDGLKFNLLGKPPIKAESATSYIILPNKPQISAGVFVDKTAELIREYYSNMRDLTGVKKSDIKPGETKKTIDLVIQFPSGTIFQPTEGDKLIVDSATAVCFIKITTIVMDALKYLSLGDSAGATYSDFEFLGHKANVTLTEQKTKPNELGICLYWEGGTISGKTEPKLILGKEEGKVGSTLKICLKERK